jgi:hypothetical protein
LGAISDDDEQPDVHDAEQLAHDDYARHEQLHALHEREAQTDDQLWWFRRRRPDEAYADAGYADAGYDRHPEQHWEGAFPG